MNLYGKTLLFLAGLTAATVSISSITFLWSGREWVVQGLRREAVALAVEAADNLDPVVFAALLDEPARAAPLGAPITAALRDLQERLGPQGVENVYAVALLDDTLRVAGDPDGSALPLATPDTVHALLKRDLWRRRVAGGTSRPYSDTWGVWISGFAPVLADGRIVALVGVDLPLGAYPVAGAMVRRSALLALALGILVTVPAGLWLARRLTRPARRLTRAMDRVREGDLEQKLPVDRADEFGRMSASFNAMVGGLREKQRIHALFQRHVSPQIADALLGGEVRTDGELREVTVLFADIRGFTSLSESLSARDLVSTLQRYYDALVPAVTEQGGVVDKFVGDEIFALFGAPLALEDDALAAVAAAREMRRRLEELNRLLAEEGRQPLAMGIGINTGAVVAGNLGSSDRMNYTVVGLAVNVGSRLVDLAGPGEILVSETTWLRLRGRVAGRARDPVPVKGVAAPVRIHEVEPLS